MELAIPLLALGGMYIISNQNTENGDIKNGRNKNINQNNSNTSNKRENFVNMGRNVNSLPNTNTPPENFPITNTKELVDTVQEFENPNAATDKYFNQSLYQNRVNDGKSVGRTPQQIYSLTGNYLDSEQFKHNNMIPFNGGKVKGQLYHANTNETILDNMAGTGSQLIKKIEQAPLFKPEENVQWAYGAPNQSDFYQSRVNPSMKNNNVKPFASEYVAPGLNQGFTNYGSGGFNSGMESRDAWLPKTVDELRVATNPKLEYELTNHEGPANSYIKNVGIIGRVEKQKPDTFFINTQDRWLTTTGAEKGETLRPIQEMGIVRRNDGSVEYTGPAGQPDRQAGYAPTNFEKSKRKETVTCDVAHSAAAGRGPISDQRLKSMTNYTNNRATLNQPDTFRSGFGGAIGAVIAPLMDILRPSRKEEVVNNVRVYGDAGTRTPQGYVLNPNDVTPTTVKETTIYSPNFYISNQNGEYVNNYTPTDLTQRDTTMCSYMGSAGGQATQYGDRSYEADYRQHNNDIKSSTINNHPNMGGTQIFNQQMNVHCARQDEDRYNCRVNAPSSVIKMPPSTSTYGRTHGPERVNSLGTDRIQGDLLQAFKSNPYTHSLTSAV